ncbi:winged helix-turn-helix domain-containing protein [Metallosphaera javensis (ex Sakai et al. 2022)]|uniref:winged helix-turn-helix domain-containing protein n=1 Tax=Metallosphaera javensis (ex Sakai et al. 2022) TaxID=2775498 RepID=UPI00258AB55D|nr:MAG: hypothetical protein MjAS7_2313 [Metallosphaera javensis (ex Sakai et al. 2022)]
MTTKRRGKLEIYLDILSICAMGGKKTEIMYKANLSYDLLNKYLHDLEQNEFITTGNTKCLTERGQRLLDLLVKRENTRREIEDLEFRISMLTSHPQGMKEGKIEVSKAN